MQKSHGLVTIGADPMCAGVVYRCLLDETQSAIVPCALFEKRDAPAGSVWHAALAEVADGSVGAARVGRSPGSGGDQDRVRRQRVHLVDRDRVVAVDDRVGAELTEVLHKVVNERVVVVDHEHTRHGCTVSSGPQRRRR